MSSGLSGEELGLLFDRIPLLAGRPRTIEELSGGLTNRNVKVTTPAGPFVARCSGSNAGPLGIDRDAEQVNSRAAEQAGVGAPVHDYRPDLGILVIGFLPGRTLDRSALGEPGMLRRVAAACRQLHAGPRFRGDFDMFERRRGYLETVRRGGYRIPDGYLSHEGTLQEIRAALAVRDEGTVPCNNDLLAENFLDDGHQLWLIDYDYAGNNDACFELGNIGTEGHLSNEQLEELVTCYYRRYRRSRIARARLQGIVGAYGWTLWGAIQHAVSPLDFDFWGWGTERYEIAVREFRGPGLRRLLDDVLLED
jgi:thiamine kinase-like enzyme